jgi:hypothetical protein
VEQLRAAVRSQEANRSAAASSTASSVGGPASPGVWRWLAGKLPGSPNGEGKGGGYGAGGVSGPKPSQGGRQ